MGEPISPTEVRRLARQACDGRTRLERQLATSLLVLAMEQLRVRLERMERTHVP